jgi:hypothetical protein
MSLQFTAVSNSIAALAVASLTIKDIDEIPTAVGDRGAMLIPASTFMTDFEVVDDSFGGGSMRKMTVSYTLNYVLCYKRAGAGRADILEYYDNMVAMTGLILDKVLAIDTFTGGIDIKPVSITNMGIVMDAAQNEYWGCYLAFRVMEFVN